MIQLPKGARAPTLPERRYFCPMRVRPVVVRFRRFYGRPPLPSGPQQGAGGVYALDIGAWLHEVEVAQLRQDLGLG